MKNVLILSAGRRVGLVEAFRVELAGEIPHARVFCTDLRPEVSPACRVAHNSFTVPRAMAPDYADIVIELCLRERVGLVVPTIDTELLPLAQAAGRFMAHGIRVVVPDEELVRACRDKRATARVFDEIGMDSPEIFPRDKIRFPCFAKPYDGSCSVGATLLRSDQDLSAAHLANERMMFMAYVDTTHDEYTVDAYYDSGGVLKCLVPRRRIEVRGGEISKGVTVRNEIYEYLLPRLSKLRGALGCITVQLFANKERSKLYAIEINPRFGGGFPLSYAAGANYPKWLVREHLMNRDQPFFDAWERDLLMLRYDAQLLVHDARGVV